MKRFLTLFSLFSLLLLPLYGCNSAKPNAEVGISDLSSSPTAPPLSPQTTLSAPDTPDAFSASEALAPSDTPVITVSETLPDDLPIRLAETLESLLFLMGRAAEQFTPFELAPYFQDPDGNESYRYYTARLLYDQSSRAGKYLPAEGLNQTMQITACEAAGDGSLTVTARHILTAGYATRGKTVLGETNYTVTLAADGLLWRVVGMRSDDPQEARLRADIDAMERATAVNGSVSTFHGEPEMDSAWPDGLWETLEAMFGLIGRADNHFVQFDLSPYFENPAENESCIYYTKKLLYHQSFRNKSFAPVVGLRQRISIGGLSSDENGLITLKLRHSVRFSYAHMESDSAGSYEYELVLVPSNGRYLIRNMASNDWEDHAYRDNPAELDRMTAENNLLPVELSEPVTD